MRQITLSALEYPTETKALVRLQEDVLRINDSKAFKAHNRPTLGLVIDRFSTEERLEGILRQAPGRPPSRTAFPGAPRRLPQLPQEAHPPKWGSTLLTDARPLEISEWLKSLPLSPKTRGHVGPSCISCSSGPCCGLDGRSAKPYGVGEAEGNQQAA